MASLKRQTQHEGLSERTVEILRLLAEGLSDREIAERVVMTINTVKWYNRQIYNVLGVSSRTQAVARAHELQLLSDVDEIEPPPSQLLSPWKLPAETTHFIGRKAEIAEIKRLLRDARLLTLVGPPGTGKTRLSLRIAREVADQFRDGVYFVALAPINDPGLVAQTIAGAIDVNNAPVARLVETLERVLSERQVLLVMDNFEHLLSAAPIVSRLLAAAPRLKVLATSREVLHVYGEQEYAVPPLQLPDPESLSTAALGTCESVALFVQRAQAVKPEFNLTNDNMLDVAKICVRLEGLPLAIELAGARVKLLTPRTLLSRLSNRLDTLAGGPHDLHSRQRTLRQTIDWSYQLLDDGEQRFFWRLGVFVGGWTLESVEAVCGVGMDVSVLDILSSLVDKSLVRQEIGEDGEPRFIMLEMIREYMLERLQASGEAALIQEQHAEFFKGFASMGAEGLIGHDQILWRKRLDADMSNFRAALGWALASHHEPLGMEIADRLVFYWHLASHVTEACHWFEQLLEAGKDAAPELRAKVLTSSAVAEFYRGDHIKSAALCRAGLALARQTGKVRTTAWAVTFLAANLMRPAMIPDEFQTMIGYYNEALGLFRQVNSRWGMARVLTAKGEATRLQGDYDQASSLYQQGLAIFRELGNLWGVTMSLNNLGYVAQHQGDYEMALSLFRESLESSLQTGDNYSIGAALNGLAAVIGMMGRPERAAQIFGAAQALFESVGIAVAPGDRPDYESTVKAVRDQLDPTAFEALWIEGRAMGVEKILTLEFTGKPS